MCTAACQGERQPVVIVSPTTTHQTSTTGSPSEEPSSDVMVETFKIGSRGELLGHLRDTGWPEAVVLSDAEPKSLELWTGDGHWHAQTTYRFAGGRVSVTQAGFEGLPPGRLVRVRGEHGVRSEGGLYWLERGFTLAISPAEKALTLRLAWIVLPN
jgi:hypothetical protein